MTRQLQCSAHDHTHSHSTWAGRALLWVALVYLAYGTAETAVAWILGEDAALLSADGTHNLLDGVSYLMFYAIDRSLKNRSRVRSWSHVLLGVAGPVSYAIGFFLPGLHDHSHNGTMTAQGTSLMIVLGALSYQLAKRCHRHAEHENAGLSAHLVGDMAGAAGVVLAALVLPFAPSAEMFVGGATFGVMACVAYVELKPLLYPLGQSVTIAHDGEVVHDDHEEAHGESPSHASRPAVVAAAVVCFGLLAVIGLANNQPSDQESALTQPTMTDLILPRRPTGQMSEFCSALCLEPVSADARHVMSAIQKTAPPTL